MEKLVAGLSAAGFSPILMLALGKGFAWLTGDYTEGPYIFSTCLVAPLSLAYYQFLLTVAQRCENDYYSRKVQQVSVPCQNRNGKIIVNLDDIMSAFERARRVMSRRVVFEPEAEVDIIDPTLPAEMKREKRRAKTQGQFEVEALPRHRGWGVVRQSKRRCITSDNLALDVKMSEPQKEAAMPIVNLRLTPEELLAFQLASLPKEDRELVEQLFLEEPMIKQLALRPDCTVRLSIVPETPEVPATETSPAVAAVPRHVQIRGVVYHGRVKS